MMYCQRKMEKSKFMKKFALLPNLTKENAEQVARNVYETLTAMDGICLMLDKDKTTFSDLPVAFLPQAKLIEEVDACISIGGDGTILYTAKIAAPYHKPVLGINAGRLGYMAGIEKHELSYLSHLIEGDFIIDKRMMLEVEFKQENKHHDKFFCINDAVFLRDASHNVTMTELLVAADGNFVGKYLADGLIFSTPTGSTAYSLSAGGPVIEPTLECITLTPICTHSLFARSLIFRPEVELSIELTTREPNGAYFSCDGEKHIPIDLNSSVYIRKSALCAQLIRIKSDTFIDILNKKLAERRA